MTLTLAQSQELAEALLRCDRVKDKPKFQTVFNELPQAIHKALWGQGRADAPLERIIATCAENEALDTLMEATGAMRRSSTMRPGRSTMRSTPAWCCCPRSGRSCGF